MREIWDSGLDAGKFYAAHNDTNGLRDTWGQSEYWGAQIVAGCMVRVGDKVVLSRRSTQPRRGFWTIPGGYVEQGESTEQGARRELAEEVGVSVCQAHLMSVYEMPQITQIVFLYEAFVSNCTPHPGVESSEVAICNPWDVPLEDLAFATDIRTMRRQRSDGPESIVECGRFYWGADGRILMAAQ